MAKKKKKVKRRQKPDVGGPVEVVGTQSEWEKCGVEIAVLARTTGRDRVIRLRETISTEAELPMPPIRVEPCGFANNIGAIWAAVVPMVIQGFNVFTVRLPVATLAFIADNKLLRRILCHEFAHCFWYLAEMYNAQQRGKDKIDVTGGKDVEKLADPADWFGPWDIKHFLPEMEDHVYDDVTGRYKDEWVDAGLPTKDPQFRFTVTHAHMEDEIFEKLAKRYSQRQEKP